MATRLDGRVSGIKIDPADLLRGLGALATPSSIQRVTRPGITKCARLVRKAARAELKDNRRTGALSRSINYVVRTAKTAASKQRHGAAPYAIVGPDAGYSVPAPTSRVKTRKYEKTIRTKTGKLIPSMYAHFLERGTSHHAAEPFLRPAFDKSAGQCRNILVADIRAGVQKEIVRIAARGRRRRIA